jgi:hypothetical protein
MSNEIYEKQFDDDHEIYSNDISLNQDDLEIFYNDFIETYHDYGNSIVNFIEELKNYSIDDLNYLINLCSNDLENPKHLILSGLIYQALDRINISIKFYKQAKKKKDNYSYYLLAQLYDNCENSLLNVPIKFKLLFHYYNNTNNLEYFVNTLDKKIIYEIFNSFVNNKKENKQLLLENKKLQDLIAMLESSK